MNSLFWTHSSRSTDVCCCYLHYSTVQDIATTASVHKNNIVLADMIRYLKLNHELIIFKNTNIKGIEFHFYILTINQSLMMVQM